MTKTKAKPRKLPTLVTHSAENIDTTAVGSSDAEQQFEVELYWCIHQLQNALNAGKLRPKQVQDHTKALNVLMSKTAPIVQKRQVMRLSFGDYRSKMAVEEKKYTKVNMQVKLMPGKPSSKSIFVKKSICTPADNNFKFDFKIPEASENVVEDVEVKMEVKTETCKNVGFATSDNSFRFNFDVTA